MLDRNGRITYSAAVSYHVPIRILVTYWRKRRKLSRAELALLVGISRPAVVQWETGVTTPSDSNLQALCDALGVTRSQFFAAEQRLSVPKAG